MPRKVTIILAVAGAAALAAGWYVWLRPRPLSRVTRAEALAIAASYVSHEWTASEANIFHGNDPRGIRVDTLEARISRRRGIEGGGMWARRMWASLTTWGGFDTPEEFDRGLREGKYAGDVYTAEKRRLLDDGVSNHTVGIDCSGFVSRCWKLPRSYSTRELPDFAIPSPIFRSFFPADIFNTHNKHVRLFAGWADDAHTKMRMYEAGPKVTLSEHLLQKMLEEGYTAWRYREMGDE
jgi:hypothetical protein